MKALIIDRHKAQYSGDKRRADNTRIIANLSGNGQDGPSGC